MATVSDAAVGVARSDRRMLRRRAPGRLRVLFAAAEVHPLVKTGGLGEVACYLPLALRERGVDARVVVPAYRGLAGRGRFRALAELAVPGTPAPVRLLVGRLPAGVPVYLVDAPDCFDREGNPYLGPDGRDWPDNARRFGVFCRAVAALAVGVPGVVWRPDVLHCNDWHTGLAPALLAGRPRRPAVLFAIHNLAYQGLFSYQDFVALGLPPALWSMEGLEFHGRLSFMKGGLMFADRLVTVSPRYAEEIQRAEHGCGLDGVLRHRRAVLGGIVNGVDYRIWDPRRDPYLERRYWLDDLSGKAANKRALQSGLGLALEPHAPLIGHIGRLTEQKGTDLILAALPALLACMPLQLAVLGSGERRLEQALRALAASFPGRVAVHTGYDEALAHRIEAGADMFLMPSRFEPCGLNQLYSLRYGTVPVVHATGGLRDTVVDIGGGALERGRATGLWFEPAVPAALAAALGRAAALYRGGRWPVLMRAGMCQDFGWTAAAERYRALYRDLRRARLADAVR